LSASSTELAPAPETTDHSQIDLNSDITAGGLEISAETPENPADRAHRHRQEAAEASLQRWKDGFRFGLSSLLVTSVTCLAAYFATAHDTTSDEKAWGRAALLAILSAVAGYFVGKGK
jgi:hypothetical protein